MDKLRLVSRRHHNHPRQSAKITYVECACMGRTISSDKPRAVDRKTHRQALQSYVMHHLIVPPLQEGRIDRAKGLESRCGHTGGKCHAMLFGDAYVKDPRWKAFLHPVHAGAGRHRGRDGDDVRVLRGKRRQRVAKDGGVGWRIGLGFVLNTRVDIEFRDTVVLVSRAFRRCVTLAFDRAAVNEHRPRGTRLGAAQHAQKLIHVVPVDGANVVKAKLFKEGALAFDTCHQLAGTARAFTDRLGRHLLHAFGHGNQSAKRTHTREVRQT